MISKIYKDPWLNLVLVQLWLTRFLLPRGIMFRASTDFWGDFRGRIYFRGYRGRTFSEGNILVCVLVRTLWGCTDLMGVVRTWRV